MSDNSKQMGSRLLPPGWHFVPHPVTGEPVALIDPNGKLQVLGEQVQTTKSKNENTTSFCKECGLKVSSSDELKKHMEYDHQNTEHACPSCGNEYENENYLNMHYEKCLNQSNSQDYDEDMLSEEKYSS